MKRRVVAAISAVCLGCMPVRHVPAPLPAAVRDSYVDLEAGQRIRVITPLTKSGRFRIESATVAEQGNTITLRAADDLLGYETSYYRVGGAGGQVRIAFQSAERVIDGNAQPAGASVVQLFRLPRGRHFTRLVFLVRESNADHDMAFLFAKTGAELDAATTGVLNGPTACPPAHCSWIPAGIAARAEVLDSAGAWQPAR